MIDAHTHIQFPAYDVDREAVIARARTAGVAHLLVVGTEESTSRSAIALAKEYPDFVSATVGFHPNHVVTQYHHDAQELSNAKRPVFNKSVFEELAHAPEVKAIGECGLDYYRLGVEAEKDKKNEWALFEQQIAIAESVKKPLMIHCRPKKGTDDAYEDLLKITAGVSVPRVVHFYVGSPAITEKLLEADFSFTFGGVITFAKDYDESIRMIPLNRVFLETDAPYVAPLSQRGKRNEPAFIVETAKRMAEIKGVAPDLLGDVVMHNAQEIFKF